ncbi:hypothetical protein CRG49_012910, partial [Neisseria sp. N95_16]
MLALSISCVCDVPETLLFVDAVILLGVPSAIVRFAVKFPPPLKPLPAVMVVLALAFSANAFAIARYIWFGTAPLTLA